MYLAPVVYSFEEKDTILHSIIRYNPVSYLLDEIRNIVVQGEILRLSEYLYSCGISIILFIICFRVFYVAERKLVEKMI